MITLKDMLNVVSFIFTIFLVLYGLRKGYDNVELVLYNLYLVTELFVGIINLLQRTNEIED